MKIKLAVFVMFLVALRFFDVPQATGQTVPPTPAPVYLPFIARPPPTPTPLSTATPIAATATPTTGPGGDTDAPHVVSWSFEPDMVNVSASDQVITFTAHFTENLSGLNFVQFEFESPSRNQAQQGRFSYPGNLISGTEYDGVYRAKLLIPRFAETGEWKLDYIWLFDKVGNHKLNRRAVLEPLGLPTSFFVQN